MKERKVNHVEFPDFPKELKTGEVVRRSMIDIINLIANIASIIGAFK